MEQNFIGAPPETAEIDQMLAAPQSGFHHRRALSDDSFRFANCFDDLLLFDFDPFEFDISNFPSPPAATGVAVDSLSSDARSLSVDSDYIDCIGITGAGADDGGKGSGENRVEWRHRHSNSVDGSSTVPFEGESSSLVKKAMAPEKLAELAKVDPKRAKRILANRQSAAKSKERKMRYTSELEKKVQALQMEATNLSTHVTMLQRDTTDLAARNKELKIRIEAMRQQAEIRSALNEALKEEVHSLKNETEQVAAIMGNPSFGGLLSQFSSQLALHQFHNPPSQDLASQQTQLCMPHPLPPSSQSFSGHCGPNFSNFNQLN